jgi:hypothetical protein
MSNGATVAEKVEEAIPKIEELMARLTEARKAMPYASEEAEELLRRQQRVSALLGRGGPENIKQASTEIQEAIAYVNKVRTPAQMASNRLTKAGRAVQQAIPTSKPGVYKMGVSVGKQAAIVPPGLDIITAPSGWGLEQWVALSVEDRIKIAQEIARYGPPAPPPASPTAPEQGIGGAPEELTNAPVATPIKYGKKVPYGRDWVSTKMNASTGSRQVVTFGEKSCKIIVKKPFHEVPGQPWQWNIRGILPGERGSLEAGKELEEVDVTVSGEGNWGRAATEEEAWQKAYDRIADRAAAGAVALLRRPGVTWVKVGGKYCATVGELTANLTKRGNVWVGEVWRVPRNGEAQLLIKMPNVESLKLGNVIRIMSKLLRGGA